jgi:hypothetical protein
MSDATVGVKQSAVADRPVDAEKIGSVYRQRVELGGAALSEIARVQATDPAGSEQALVVRPIAPTGGLPVDVAGFDPIAVNPQPDELALPVRPVFPDYSTAWFGRQRVAIATLLFDAVHRYALDDFEWDSATNGGATLAHVPATASISFTVPTTSGAYAKLRTNTAFRYQPGRSQRILMTCWHLDAGRTNQVRRWGYFDDNDGVFFELSGTTLYLVRRTSTGVEASEERVPQASWNGDVMDGSGASAIDLDLTKANLFEIDIAWLGVGEVRVFVDRQLVHTFRNPNMIAGPYMAKGSLPLSYEVVNTGAASSGGIAFHALCAAVFADGGWNELGPVFGQGQASQKANVGGSYVPLLAMRPTALLDGVTNRSVIVPLKVRAFCETNRASVKVVLGGTLTNATWAIAGPTGSAVEFDEAATAITGGVSVAIDFMPNTNERGVIDLEGGVFSYTSRKLRRHAWLPASEFDLLTIVGRSEAAGNTDLLSAISWREIR